MVRVHQEAPQPLCYSIMRVIYATQGYDNQPITEDKLVHQSFRQGVSGSIIQEYELWLRIERLIILVR